MTDDLLAEFAAVRPRLFGIAYRMLGSAVEAEDIVQDSWLRWQATDRSLVRDVPAFLATITTRLAITLSQSARMRHETYIGPWLPEPVDTSADPTLGAERGEALSVAVLMLLEKLTPTERAAYILREAFDYEYLQISEIIQVSEASARQLVSRGRKHLVTERRQPVTSTQQERLLTAFVAAAQSGDLARLERLLAEDVVSYSDGGGAVRASRFPVVGRERVAKFLRAFAPRFWTGVDVELRHVNGQPSAVLSRDSQTFAVLFISSSPEGVDRVMWLMNPAKLVQLG